MRIWLLSLISFSILSASSISTPLLEINKEYATVAAENLRIGMSGFIVRSFDKTHTTIISNANVEEINATTALLRLSAYDGLHQNALPSGTWSPKVSDMAILAYDYGRGLLIAPDDDTYDALTKNIPGIEWVHPDNYAAYLSFEGHPTPLVEDFHNYCTANSIGLLYIQTAQTLFTLDCKNFTLLQTAPSLMTPEKSLTPFYSRIPSIRSAWWGEGSSNLESYEPYYLDLIALNNPKNKELYQLYKAKFGDKSALLRHFDIKE